jgi:hypothetical protein
MAQDENRRGQINLKDENESLRDNQATNLYRAKDILFDSVKLIVTISTSVLALSVALIRFIMEFDTALHKYLIYSSWFLFFVAILAGIKMQGLGSKFFFDLAEQEGRLLSKNYIRMLAGESTRQKEFNQEETHIRALPLFWVYLEAYSFSVGLVLFATFFLVNF